MMGGDKFRLGAGIGILAVILFLILFKPLVVSEVAYTVLSEDAANISFELRNRFPGSLRIDAALVPLDTTSGVAFDSRPLTRETNGAVQPLIGYLFQPLDKVHVTIPIAVTGLGNVREVRLEYRLLGVPKHVTVPVHRVSM